MTAGRTDPSRWLGQLATGWRGRRHFVLLDLAFGRGANSLAVWQAWNSDPQRSDRLVIVAVSPAHEAASALAHCAGDTALRDMAQAWSAAWPAPVPGWHTLAFDSGRVRLHLRLGAGDALAALREVSPQANAILLGRQPSSDNHRWLAKALARAAAPDATLIAAGVDPALQRELQASGFRPTDPTGLVEDTWMARFAPRAQRVATSTIHTSPRHALVIGAGLAGAATAAALAGWGWSVMVLDRHTAPASETSGNPAGLYHGVVHASDGRHTRLFRAAALHAERVYEPLITGGAVTGGRGGLLRLADDDPLAMQQRLLDQGLPSAYVQALDRGAASALAGVPVPGAAWWYPGGGWLAPTELVQTWLRSPGVRFRGDAAVGSIRPGGPGWQVLDAEGAVLAEAGVLVVAGASESPRLLAPHAACDWPLHLSRGQVSGWTSAVNHGLKVPVAAGSYALPLNAGSLLCGATNDADDNEAQPRDTDDDRNFERLAWLTGLVPPQADHTRLRRVGWRLQTADRLPIAGPVATSAAVERAVDQLPRVPRTPGLYVLGALGSRGITLAPLLGDLLAAQIVGAPWPVERALAEAVDPARWLVRAVRRSRRPG